MMVRKGVRSTKTLISKYCSILTLFSNHVWETKRQTVEYFVDKEWYFCGKEVGWSACRVRKVLSFIYRIAPLTPPHPSPCSSMSHLPCWCWCHFSNASMGTGDTMTPALTTNSSFNTSAKRLVCHTGFKSPTVSVFVHKMTKQYTSQCVFVNDRKTWTALNVFLACVCACACVFSFDNVQLRCFYS